MTTNKDVLKIEFDFDKPESWIGPAKEAAPPSRFDFGEFFIVNHRFPVMFAQGQSIPVEDIVMPDGDIYVRNGFRPATDEDDPNEAFEAFFMYRKSKNKDGTETFVTVKTFTNRTAIWFTPKQLKALSTDPLLDDEQKTKLKTDKRCRLATWSNLQGPELHAGAVAHKVIMEALKQGKGFFAKAKAINTGEKPYTYKRDGEERTVYPTYWSFTAQGAKVYGSEEEMKADQDAYWTEVQGRDSENGNGHYPATWITESDNYVSQMIKHVKDQNAANVPLKDIAVEAGMMTPKGAPTKAVGGETVNIAALMSEILDQPEELIADSLK